MVLLRCCCGGRRTVPGCPLTSHGLIGILGELFSVSGVVEVGSIPATGLALVVILFFARWISQRNTEVPMMQKPAKTTKTCPENRFTSLTRTAIACSLETTWAIGVSRVAAIGTTLPTH